MITSLVAFLQKPGDVLLSQHLAAAMRSTGRCLAQTVFTLLCLPYEAFFSMDAIARTTWRMLLTDKRLLEWNPSGDSDRNSRTDLTGSFRTMWVSPVIAIAARDNTYEAMMANIKEIKARGAPVIALVGCTSLGQTSTHR